MVEQKHAAKFDELTNLHNRRYTLKRMKQEMGHAVRHDLLFSLCVIDLDGFKRINDQHGHLFGDYLLKRVCIVQKRRRTWRWNAGDTGVIDWRTRSPCPSERTDRASKILLLATPWGMI